MKSPKHSTPENKGSDQAERIYLCVVDRSEELSKALRFACRRAVHTNSRVGLVTFIEPADFQHWMFVGNLMRDEQLEEAQEMLHVVANVVEKRTGRKPLVYVREGKIHEQLIDLIREETGIALLVLGAATGPEGPGDLVSSMVQKLAGRLRCPITVVPGNLSDDDIDAIT
ncbi:MAG: universal stress protein [Magnetovibrionaceae bacterium]